MNFDIPINREDISDGAGGVNRNWYKLLLTLRNAIVWRTQHGPTSERPTKYLEIGMPYFDETLGVQINLKSINPNVWVNGVGTSV